MVKGKTAYINAEKKKKIYNWRFGVSSKTFLPICSTVIPISLIWMVKYGNMENADAEKKNRVNFNGISLLFTVKWWERLELFLTFDGLPTFVLLLVVEAALFGGFIPAEKIATKKLFRHFDRKKIEWRGQNSKTESFISFVNTFFVVRKKKQCF